MAQVICLSGRIVGAEQGDDIDSGCIPDHILEEPCCINDLLWQG